MLNYNSTGVKILYVTGGQYKGRKIITPTNVKPTLAKVREGVFASLYSILGEVDKFSFLDMFTGSAIMGIEAYSRGFILTSFEKNLKTSYIIKENYKNLNIEADFYLGDALKLLKKTDKTFDVIYIDPPWEYSYSPLIKEASKHLKDGGIIIAECDKKRVNELCQKDDTTIVPLKEKVYGRTCVMFLINKVSK